MSIIKDCYKKLYESSNIPSGYRNTPFSGLSHFVGMSGKNYNSQTTKLLIVGRAVNGWKSLDCSSAENFSAKALERFSENFPWVVYDQGVLRNDEKDKDTGKYYWLNKSSFWRVSKQIWMRLSDRCDFIDSEREKWVDNIAWTNLYKIAPKITGNPTTTMCKKQLEACKEILKTEIDSFDPTHILFITGYEWWFKDFESVFDTVFHDCSDKGDGYAEVYAESKNRKIVVACRPERKDETAYVEEVVSAFNFSLKR